MAKIINFQHYRLYDTLFSELIMKRGYNVEYHQRWETLEPNSAPKAIKVGIVLYQVQNVTAGALIFETRDAIVCVEDSAHNSEITVQVQATTLAVAKSVMDKIKKAIKVAPEPMSTEISVRFWYLSNNGPKAVHRNIAAPDWDNIQGNYNKATFDGLNHLMKDFKPTAGGQLVLWHGQPGTGKTYALRALCQAWKEWCSVEYIMDPETLLGASPGYLASMIMNDAPDDDEENENPSGWKLLIMEDTGELLTEHARERSGQGLSRLLNVVDGFIGQGLRVLVLITTNEEFHKLHPAVSREGRCAASIKFNPLDQLESISFLNTHKAPNLKLDKGKTIAELYAMLKESTNPRDVNGIREAGPLGFRMPNA